MNHKRSIAFIYLLLILMAGVSPSLLGQSVRPQVGVLLFESDEDLKVAEIIQLLVVSELEKSKKFNVFSYSISDFQEEFPETSKSLSELELAVAIGESQSFHYLISGQIKGLGDSYLIFGKVFNILRKEVLSQESVWVNNKYDGTELQAAVDALVLSLFDATSSNIVTDLSPESSLFAHVKGGTFTMGSNVSPFGNAKPQHPVTLSSYWIGRYEITQSLWETVMNYNNSDIKGSNLPVTNITWTEAIEFSNQLSLREGLTPVYTINSDRSVTADWDANGYRLPTEAEWEYAAKGGHLSQGFTYSGSNNLNDVAWTYESRREGRPSEVGKKNSNELGVYDMTGNVWEWVWDWLDEAYYSYSPEKDPKGPEYGNWRVVRGGSYYNSSETNEDIFRTTVRAYEPTNSNRYLGFRLARTK